MQLGSDLMVFENPVAELYWMSLPEVPNVEGKLGSSVARGVMSGSPSRDLGHLIWSDVGLDELGLDDEGTQPIAEWWSFPPCALRFATCRDHLWGRELTTTDAPSAFSLESPIEEEGSELIHAPRQNVAK